MTQGEILRLFQRVTNSLKIEGVEALPVPELVEKIMLFHWNEQASASATWTAEDEAIVTRSFANPEKGGE